MNAPRMVIYPAIKLIAELLVASVVYGSDADMAFWQSEVDAHRSSLTIRIPGACRE